MPARKFGRFEMLLPLFYEDIWITVHQIEIL
jgi:hypothetical protein